MIIENSKSTLLRFFEYSYYVFFALFPFINYRNFLYFGTTTRAINLLFFGLVVVFFLGFWLLNKKNTISFSLSPVVAILGLYICTLTISAIFGLNFEISFWSNLTRLTGIWYFLCFGALLFALWSVIYNKVQRERLILIIIISSALYSFASFLGLEGVGVMFKSMTSDGFTFGNSTFAGMYLFGAFLLSIYYLYSKEIKRWWMWTLPVLLVINPYIINREIWFGNFAGGITGIVGEARASAYVTFFSIFALIFIWMVSRIKNLRTRSIVSYSIFGFSVLSMIILAFSLLTPGGLIRNIYLSQATGARPLVWEVSSKVVGERPLFGWGSDNFERVFEINYDNRILQKDFGAEAWFDRAHNVFVDQAVDNGFVGLTVYILVYLVIILSMIFVALRSSSKNDSALASILIVYSSFHLLELQTAFDTTISYGIILFVLTSAGVLFHRTIKEIKGKSYEYVLPLWGKYSLGSILIIFSFWSMFYAFVPFVNSQIVNGKMRTVGDSDKRIPMYETLLGSVIDKHAVLWRTTTDFQRGVAENPSVLEDPRKYESLGKELKIMENEYREYVRENPKHFRAHLSLADILMYSSLFGENNLDEAHKVLDEAIKLVPQAPQSYWMKTVAYVYVGKFDLAREYAKKGLDLNPNIKESQEIVDYVERQARSFPEIDIYFFRQI